MHKSIFLSLILFLSVPNSVQAQRYVDEVFEQTKSETVTYREKGNEKLAMDIYSPVADTVINKPVVLYVHGGGFSGGKRDHPNHLKFCEQLTKKGYVAVTMSYTLIMKGRSFGCDLPAKAKIATFRSVALDIAYATKYLIENKTRLGIDAQKIILAGSSAGAEAVLHAAYMKDSWKHNNNNVLSTNFNFGGVISMAGAIVDKSLITNSSAIPTQLFHGTCDNLVPYGAAPHHYCDTGKSGYLMLYGAKSIAEQLQKINKGYYLVTGCNGGHEWNDLPIRKYVALISDFIFNDVISGAFRQLHVVKISSNDCGNNAAELPSVCEQ